MIIYSSSRVVVVTKTASDVLKNQSEHGDVMWAIKNDGFLEYNRPVNKLMYVDYRIVKEWAAETAVCSV